MTGTEGNVSARFPASEGLSVVQAEYVTNDNHGFITFDYAETGSRSTLTSIRNHFLTDASRAGFGSPIIEGDRFFMAEPFRHRTVQKDFAGWIIPGKGVLVIQRYAVLPVEPDARVLGLGAFPSRSRTSCSSREAQDGAG